MEAVQTSARIRTNKQAIVKAITKYLTIFGVQVALSVAQIYGMRPFGAGFFIALTFLNVPWVVTLPFFIAAECIASADLYTLLSAAICAAVILAGKLISKKAGKAHRYLFPLFVISSRAGLLLLPSSFDYTILMIIVSTLLTLAFSYAAQIGLRPVLVEKLRYKMLETELTCLACIVIATALGLSGASIYGFPTLVFVAVISIFSAARLAGAGASVILALCFGLGDALNTYGIQTLGTLVFIAAVSGIFVSAPRILTALTGVVAYVIFTFYFTADYTQTALTVCAIFAGGIIFAAVPKQIFSQVKEKVFASHERAAVRYMINKSRADTGNALLSAARIFDGMAGMIVSQGEKPPLLSGGSLEVKCCEFCENKDECRAAGVFDALGDMMKKVRKTGHVAVHDIPDAVSQKCLHLGRLVSKANEIEESNKKLAVQNECEASARKLMARCFSGVSTTVKNTAMRLSSAFPFDGDREKTVVEELNYCGVSCAQCIIAGDSVTLVLRTECLDKKLIEKVIGRLMRAPYRVSGIDDTALAGFCAVMLEKAPRYDVVFGVAGCPKKAGEKSGDTHSFIRLGSDKLMIALCDGMGSGEAAENISETAVELIENFFRAGFDSSLVIKSVNTFLSTSSRGGFSAIDIAVIDLETLKADIIKLSTPATYIKHKDEIHKIEGTSLPLGAVEMLNPFVTTVDLNVGDILVLATDGVADSFVGDKLAAAVNNLRTVNPRVMAEGILEHTLSNLGGVPRDDSTVVCAKIVGV